MKIETSLKAALDSQLKKLYVDSAYKLKHYDPKNPPDFRGGIINKRTRHSSMRENTYELERKFTNPFKMEMQKKIEKYQMNMKTKDRSKSFRDQRTALASL